MKPGEKGISLTVEEWGELVRSISIVDEHLLLITTFNQFVENYIDGIMEEALDASIHQDTDNEVINHVLKY